MTHKAPLTCIALRTTRYNERFNILAAYSLEIGRVSLLIPTSTSNEARRIRALTQPLSTFNCVASISPNRDIFPISQCQHTNNGSSLATNPVKAAIALFLAEVMTTLLRESQTDTSLFNYINNSIATLSSLSDGYANFHICFLYHLSRYIGIAPDTATYHKNSVFDFRSATFIDAPPLHRDYLSPDDSATFHTISRMTFQNMGRFAFNRQQRNQVIDLILRYYSIHYASLSTLQSTSILRSLFD